MFTGAQGTYGIATAGAISLKTLHEVRKAILISFNRIEEALSAVNQIRSVEIGEETFIANSRYLSLMLTDSPGEAIEKYRDHLAAWTVVVVISGWPEEVAYQQEDLEEIAQKGRFELLSELPGIADAGNRILKEISYPLGSSHQQRYKGAWNPIFTYVLPQKVGQMIQLTQSLAKTHHYPSDEIGFFLLPLDYARAYYFEPSFYSNPQDTAERQQINNLFDQASEALFREGAVFDRPYGAWAEMVYSNAAKYHRKIKGIKQMLDPENIMNPGKLGFYKGGMYHG